VKGWKRGILVSQRGGREAESLGEVMGMKGSNSFTWVTEGTAD